MRGSTKMNNPPSIQEWKNLYDTAIELKQTAPWQWMWDSDIFGVQNPANNEIGYCCIMGKLGQMFALAVYLDTEGLEGYLKIRSEEILADDPEALHIQKCLMVSLEDREYLKDPDLQVIKELGLKFRGHNSWPSFRSYRPGYYPWYLTSDEAIYLTIAIQQAIDVCLRFKNDKSLLRAPKENHYLVRVQKKEGEKLIWTDEWLKPIPLGKAEIVAEPIDEIRLQKLKNIPRGQGIWEIDYSHFPGVVKEGERPYYPYVILVVDYHSGLILTFHIAPPAKYGSEFINRILNFIETNRILPKEVLVKKEEAFKLFEPITSRLEIKLRQVKTLEAIESARESMFNYFT